MLDNVIQNITEIKSSGELLKTVEGLKSDGYRYSTMICLKANEGHVAIENEDLDVNLTEQIYFEVKESDKFEALCRIIDIEDEFYGLVFCRTKTDTAQLAQKLGDRGYSADALHGDLSQNEREKILNRFRKQKINILAATDVAARGIDIMDLMKLIVS